MCVCTPGWLRATVCVCVCVCVCVPGWPRATVCVCVCVLALADHSLRMLLLLIQLTFSVTPSYLDSCEFIVFMCSVPQSCLTLCEPMDCSLPGSSVHGILQARTLEWVARPSPRGSSQPKDQTHVSCVSCIGRRVLYH